MGDRLIRWQPQSIHTNKAMGVITHPPTIHGSCLQQGLGKPHNDGSIYSVDFIVSPGNRGLVRTIHFFQLINITGFGVRLRGWLNRVQADECLEDMYPSALAVSISPRRRAACHNSAPVLHIFASDFTHFPPLFHLLVGNSSILPAFPLFLTITIGSDSG
jgi:hypothetical protein